MVRSCRALVSFRSSCFMMFTSAQSIAYRRRLLRGPHPCYESLRADSTPPFKLFRRRRVMCDREGALVDLPPHGGDARSGFDASDDAVEWTARTFRGGQSE